MVTVLRVLKLSVLWEAMLWSKKAQEIKGLVGLCGCSTALQQYWQVDSVTCCYTHGGGNHAYHGGRGSIVSTQRPVRR